MSIGDNVAADGIELITCPLSMFSHAPMIEICPSATLPCNALEASLWDQTVAHVVRIPGHASVGDTRLQLLQAGQMDTRH